MKDSFSAKTLRVYVEPVNVELDDDGGLSWTSLASAFPGCSNLYYKGPGHEKTMVKFDGKRYERSGGHWNDNEYFVTLGSRTMNYPFGSYENASKQFERSVNAVQNMLGGSLFTVPNGRKKDSSIKKVAKTPLESLSQPKEETFSQDKENQVINSIQEREQQLRLCSRRLSPIEEQFVDLARISNAKDAIIEQQREEAYKLRDNISALEKEVNKWKEEAEKQEKRAAAQEEELNILRRLSHDQTYMCDKVADLAQRLSEKEVELTNVRNDLNTQISRLREDYEGAKAKLETTSSQLNDTTSRWHVVQEDLKLRTMEIYEMELEVKRLRTLAKRVNLDSPEHIQCYTDTMDDNSRLRKENEELMEDLNRQKETRVLFEKNAVENTRLMERNFELEKRVNMLTDELSNINDKWKRNVGLREEEWNVKRSELEMERGELRRQLSELQSMFESATRDVAETTRRLDEVVSAREEMKREMDRLQHAHQEYLESSRDLQARAKESEGRVSELTFIGL